MKPTHCERGHELTRQNTYMKVTPESVICVCLQCRLDESDPINSTRESAMEKTFEAPAATTRPNPHSCLNCRFCGSLINSDGRLFTVCRQQSPLVTAQAFPTQQGQIVWATNTAWPAVTDTDWCGAFEGALSS